MKPLKTIQATEQALRDINAKSINEGDAFIAKCFPLLIKEVIELGSKIDVLNEKFKEQVKQTGKTKRKASEYNTFVSYHMKQGKSMAEVGAMWKNRKPQKITV